MTLSDRAVLAELARRQDMLGPGGLMEFIPHVSPGYVEPTHLRPLVDLIESSRVKPVRGLISVPPRHAKTETILHAIAWLLANDPSARIAYVSYSADIAKEKAAVARRIAVELGVKPGSVQKADRWETSAGGCIAACGVKGGLTGRGYRWIFVDDSVKNHEEAESPTIRDNSFHGFMSDILTRRDPKGTSVIVCGTRWNRDDLIGRLAKMGWPEINLPAINDAGEALAPHMGWTLEVMEGIRAETIPYVWSALYQGRPVARGAELFGEAVYYDHLPTDGVMIAIGIDLAYTKKTSSDWSIAVVMYRHGRSGTERYFVVDVVRRQVRAPVFLATLGALSKEHGHPRTRWYCAGPEIGSADFVVEGGVRLEAKPATADKFVRAMPVSAAWNAKKVFVPRKAPWLRPFLDVVQGFSGVDDDHDDDVDALAAAFDILCVPSAAKTRRLVEGIRMLNSRR